MEIIVEDTKLIIFDFIGTMIGTNKFEPYRPTKGINDLLLQLYSKKKLLAISNEFDKFNGKVDFETLINNYPAYYINWGTYFKGRIYDGKEHIIDYNGINSIKNLGKIMSDCEISNPKESVFIGNNDLGLDQKSANAFGIPFILVNEFTDFYRDFYVK